MKGCLPTQEVRMVYAPDPVTARHMEDIAYNRRALVRSYASLIESLDAAAAGNWRTIVGAAREAGLSKDDLCQSFSCAWTTILRWEAGRNAPGPFARRAMKAKLLDMLAALDRAEGKRLQELQTAVAQERQVATV
jgi:ribosome-binding protein aMBF1 (putative translation factor)